MRVPYKKQTSVHFSHFLFNSPFRTISHMNFSNSNCYKTNSYVPPLVLVFNLPTTATTATTARQQRQQRRQRRQRRQLPHPCLSVVSDPRPHHSTIPYPTNRLVRTPTRKGSDDSDSFVGSEARPATGSDDGNSLALIYRSSL
jgi:hypothetical protein